MRYNTLTLKSIIPLLRHLFAFIFILLSCSKSEIEPNLPINNLLINFTISTSSNFGGTVTSGKPVKAQDIVKIVATPSKGYQLKQWSGNCGEFSNDVLEINFKASKHCNVHAEFEKKTFTIHSIITDGGNITYGENQILGQEGIHYKYGEFLALKASPDEGYQFLGWEISRMDGDSTDISCPTIENPLRAVLTFVIEGHCRLKANFGRIPRTITTQVKEGGTITETQTVEHGNLVIIKASNAKHYRLKQWKSNCGDFSSEESTILFIAEKDCDVTAIFEKLAKHTISIKSNFRGRVFHFSEDGNKDYSTTLEKYLETDLLFEVETNEGYNFTGWKTYGSGCYDIVEPWNHMIRYIVQGDCVLEPTFLVQDANSSEGDDVNNQQDLGEKQTTTQSPDPKNLTTTIFMISTSSGLGGTISQNKEVLERHTVKIIANPNNGYHIKSWGGNCGDFDKSSSTVSFIAEKDCSISVAFEKTVYHIITVKKNPIHGGSVYARDGGTFQYVQQGKILEFNARAKARYKFKYWDTNCSDAKPNKSQPHVLVVKGTGDCYVKAVFGTPYLNSVIEEEVITTFGNHFDDDPIYSKITYGDAQSYLTAFIRDARRHGYKGDLNVSIDDFSFSVPAESTRASALPCKLRPLKVSIQSNVWKDLSSYLHSNNRPDIHLMWHELGHAILCRAHTSDFGSVMYPSISANRHLLFVTNDDSKSWKRAVDDLFSGKNQASYSIGHIELHEGIKKPLEGISCSH